MTTPHASDTQATEELLQMLLGMLQQLDECTASASDRRARQRLAVRRGRISRRQS
jgi:hypothetical protein